MPLQSLQQVLGVLETQYKPQPIQQVIQCWPEVVGPIVAAQTRPLSLQRSILRVATSSAAWAQNLVFERQRILEKLNNQLSLALTDIRFSTAQWTQPAAAKTSFGAQEQALLWQAHPSRLPESNQLASLAPVTAASGLTDPVEVFHNWTRIVKSRTHHLPNCPQCHCPTPPGELDRWQVCSLCAAKQWKE